VLTPLVDGQTFRRTRTAHARTGDPEIMLRRCRRSSSSVDDPREIDFLATRAACNITGQCITIDGGGLRTALHDGHVTPLSRGTDIAVCRSTAQQGSLVPPHVHGLSCRTAPAARLLSAHAFELQGRGYTLFLTPSAVSHQIRESRST
jgi:hypothetical protein